MSLLRVIPEAGLSQETWARLITGLVLGGIGFLLTWSLVFRVSLVGDAQSMIYSSFALEQEIVDLKTGWSPDQTKKLNAEIDDVRTRLFHDYDDLGQWLMAVKGLEHDMPLTLDFKLGEDHVPLPGAEKVVMVPIEFFLESQSPGQAYRHYLGVMRQLSESPYYVDIHQAKISGTGHGALSLKLVVQVLMLVES